MNKNYRCLYKYIPYLEKKKIESDSEFYKNMDQLNQDSYELLKQYPGHDRGPKTEDFLFMHCRTRNGKKEDPFHLNPKKCDEETLIALINMTFSLNRWSGSLVYDMVKEGKMLQWILRLKEMDEKESKKMANTL